MRQRSPRWRIFDRFSENLYLLCHHDNGSVRYAPLYIHVFRLIAPRKLLEAQLFNQQYHSYEEIENVQDRLRWCRHHMGLMQKEVAALVGITRGNYIDLETAAVDHYPKEVVDRLAKVFEVPPEDLLDEYNRFLYDGQGKGIREHRLQRALTQTGLAKELGIDPSNIQVWEAEKKRISKASWEKYFKKGV